MDELIHSPRLPDRLPGQRDDTDHFYTTPSAYQEIENFEYAVLVPTAKHGHPGIWKGDQWRHFGSQKHSKPSW